MTKTSPKTAIEFIPDKFYIINENGNQVGSIIFSGQFWLFYHIGASQARYRAGSLKHLFEDLNITIEDKLGEVEYTKEYPTLLTVEQIKLAIVEAAIQNDIVDIRHYTLLLEGKLNGK